MLIGLLCVVSEYNVLKKYRLRCVRT